MEKKLGLYREVSTTTEKNDIKLIKGTTYSERKLLIIVRANECSHVNTDILI